MNRKTNRKTNPTRTVRRWQRTAGVLTVFAVMTLAAPSAAFASNWSAALVAGSHGEAQSGDVSETVNSTCTATSPSTQCGTTDLVPVAGSTSTATVKDTGTGPLSYGLSDINCGAVTISDGSSNLTVAHGSFSSANFGVAGPLGGSAISFDGSTDWLGTGGAGAAGPQIYTQLAWFKTSSAVGGPILSFSNALTPGSAANMDRHLWVDNAGYLVAGVFTTTYEEVVDTTAKVNNGAWHLAAVTLSSAGFKLYVDGTLLTTNAATTSAYTYPSAWWSVASANLAGWTNSPTATNGNLSFFNGSLAGVAVLPTALTAGQISTLYSAGTMASYASDVAGDSTPTYYWGMQDAAPTPATASTAGLPGQSTTTYPDLSGNANNANVNGGVTASGSGPLSSGGSATFNGSSGYLTTTNSVTAPQTYTQLAWFKTSGTGAIQPIFWFGADNNDPMTNGNAQDRLVFLNSSGNLVAYAYNGSAQFLTSSAGSFNNGSWNFVAVTLSSAGFAIYVNGSPQGSLSTVTSAETYGTATYWALGAGNASDTDYYLNGSLAGAAVLPTALNASQISALYNSSSFSAYSGAVLADSPSEYWSLTTQPNACSAGLVTVAVTIASTTTCLLPAKSSGTACPAVATGGLPLADLSAATVNAAVSAAAGATATITIKVADNGTLPAALGGVNIVLDATLSAADQNWTAGAVYASSWTEL
jgi:hypothetical protein